MCHISTNIPINEVTETYYIFKKSGEGGSINRFDGSFQFYTYDPKSPKELNLFAEGICKKQNKLF